MNHIESIAEQILTLIRKKQYPIEFYDLLSEIVTLNEELKNDDNRSWYFKKAFESREKRMDYLLKRYNYVKESVNEKSFLFWSEAINNVFNNILKVLESDNCRSQKINKINCFLDQLFIIGIFIWLKNYYSKLEDISFFINNPIEIKKLEKIL